MRFRSNALYLFRIITVFFRSPNSLENSYEDEFSH